MSGLRPNGFHTLTVLLLVFVTLQRSVILSSTVQQNTTVGLYNSTFPNVKIYRSYIDATNAKKYNNQSGLAMQGGKKKKLSVERQPIQPMISPRYNNNNNNNRRSSTRDSYLAALEYSHTMKIKDPGDHIETSSKAPNRRLHVESPGPVYRGEKDAVTNDNVESASNIIKSVELDNQESRRVTFSNGPFYKPTAPEEPIVGSNQPIGSFNYGNYQNLDTYPLPEVSYGKPFQSSSYGPPPIYDSYGLPPYVHSLPAGGSPYLEHGTLHQGLGSLQATYSTSHTLPDILPLTILPSLDLSWPISIKINSFTVLKIILKIILFKMIVKFIAAVCLLLFVPKLLPKKHETDDYDDQESRKFAGAPTAKNLQILAKRINESIYHYDIVNGANSTRNKLNADDQREEEQNEFAADCPSVDDCQINESQKRSGLIFNLPYDYYNDTLYDYARLFKLYVEEESYNEADRT